jgi:branched-chain amino acid transport system ATP-binding protein
VLSLRNVNGWYGRAHVLQGVDIDVEAGEVVSLIGRNGAGKTSLLRAIMGLMPRCEGEIAFLGADLQAKQTHERFRLGLGYVPEERRIVQGLSVAENIELGLIAPTAAKYDKARVEEVLEMFPRLRERWRQPATTMSGGEQQMLAIARALVSAPKLLMLDEPSEGIMPRLVDEMFQLFGRIAANGLTILLVEQNVSRALSISQRAYIVDQGRIVVSETAANLLANPEVRDRYCSV